MTNIRADDRPEPINTSGTDLPAPLEVREMGFCWGAFALPLYFSWANNITLGCLFSGLPMSLWLLKHGHEAAWKNRHFRDLKQFQDTMRAWNRWGIVHTAFAGLFFLLMLIYVVGVSRTFGSHGAFVPADDALASSNVCLQNVRSLALACQVYGYDCEGRLPPAGNWRQAIGPLCPGHQLPKCPSGGVYTYNPHVAGRRAQYLASNTVLIYEGDAQGRQTYPHGDESWVVGPDNSTFSMSLKHPEPVEWLGKAPARAPVDVKSPETTKAGDNALPKLPR